MSKFFGPDAEFAPVGAYKVMWFNPDGAIIAHRETAEEATRLYDSLGESVMKSAAGPGLHLKNYRNGVARHLVT